MAQPSRTTVTIDGQSFNALTTSFGLTTEHDNTGLPMMGSVACAIDIHVDINDTLNMPFETLKTLFNMANVVTRDKVKDIKIDFWTDDTKTDVVCSFSFTGWINHYNITSSGEGNHILTLSLQPSLAQNNFYEISMGN